ncbi:MAG TPA: hypothetical protein VFW33_10695 [Gemmataceae bacterium]|nr:hypothetical protein [Gemmataceae bacterium]
MTYAPPPPYALRPAAPPTQPTARAQSPAAPKVRFQKPDDPPASERRAEKTTVALTLPPPEQLGIGSPPAAADLDMNALNTRLDELGAESTEWRKTPEGYRFVCKLASADGKRTGRIETDAPTRAEAARQLLARAEKWAHGQ